MDIRTGCAFEIVVRVDKPKKEGALTISLAIFRRRHGLEITDTDFIITKGARGPNGIECFGVAHSVVASVGYV